MLLASVMSFGLLGRTDRALDENSDVQLARRVARGEVEALGALYDAHHEAVRAFAQRLFADRAEAEDLTQEVFLSAPEVLKRFEGRAALRTFLLSIAVNHARHQKRSLARRLGAMEKLHQEPKQFSESPDAAQERAVLARRMERLLAALPIDQRVAVVLCVVEERTSVEAAAIVGVPEATIRTRVFHALRKMREMRDEKEGA